MLFKESDMQLTKDVQGIKCTNITRNLQSFIKSICNIATLSKFTRRRQRSTGQCQCTRVQRPGSQSRDVGCPRLNLRGLICHHCPWMKLFVITEGGDEVLPVRHPRDHVNHGRQHDPDHHQPGGLHGAQLLVNFNFEKYLIKESRVEDTVLKSAVFQNRCCIVKVVTFAEVGWHTNIYLCTARVRVSQLDAVWKIYLQNFKTPSSGLRYVDTWGVVSMLSS